MMYYVMSKGKTVVSQRVHHTVTKLSVIQEYSDTSTAKLQPTENLFHTCPCTECTQNRRAHADAKQTMTTAQ